MTESSAHIMKKIVVLVLLGFFFCFYGYSIRRKREDFVFMK